jgi:hypothetical protein
MTRVPESAHLAGLKGYFFGVLDSDAVLTHTITAIIFPLQLSIMIMAFSQFHVSQERYRPKSSA